MDRDSDLVLVSVGHDTWSLQPALVGYVETKLTVSQLTEHLRVARGREEMSELRWIELEPACVWQAVDELKRKDQILPWVEVGLYATLLSFTARHGLDPGPTLRLFSRDELGWPGVGQG